MLSVCAPTSRESSQGCPMWGENSSVQVLMILLVMFHTSMMYNTSD